MVNSSKIHTTSSKANNVRGDMGSGASKIHITNNKTNRGATVNNSKIHTASSRASKIRATIVNNRIL
jgi:hypothetical protein